jgi:hypothetical protein
MSMLKDADHTALRINISRILELFQRGDIDPPDAVADLLKLCHPDFVGHDGEGLDSYLAKTLAMVTVGEVSMDSALTHLIRLATAKTVDADHLSVLG